MRVGTIGYIANEVHHVVEHAAHFGISRPIGVGSVAFDVPAGAQSWEPDRFSQELLAPALMRLDGAPCFDLTPDIDCCRVEKDGRVARVTMTGQNQMRVDFGSLL